MGSHVVKVPDVGEGIAEVELVSWAVTVGETVRRNQVLAEVMTDKANVEIPAPADGVIADLSGEIGGILAVGSPLITLTVDGDAPVPVAAEAPTPQAPPTEPEREPEPMAASTRGQTPATQSVAYPPVRGLTPTGAPRDEGEAPRASPAVRHRAREGGIDLRRVAGTGPAGRITHEDLDAYWHAGTNGAAPSRTRAENTSVDTQPIIGIRRQIAQRMLASTQSIPHITYVDEVDVTALEELRATLNDRRHDDQPRLTLLPFLARAIVAAIGEVPQTNAHVDDEAGTLITHGGVHIGIATQTPNGLVVPVVRHAEARSIWSLASEIASLATAARDGKAAPADLSGSTITITSLGSLGGLVTTPVINKPEVAIVGVNKIATRPVWLDDAFVPRKVMNLSSSFDHRVIDGWDAATFIQHIKISLEQPALLFVDE